MERVGGDGKLVSADILDVFSRTIMTVVMSIEPFVHSEVSENMYF